MSQGHRIPGCLVSLSVLMTDMQNVDGRGSPYLERRQTANAGKDPAASQRTFNQTVVHSDHAAGATCRGRKTSRMQFSERRKRTVMRVLQTRPKIRSAGPSVQSTDLDAVRQPS